MKGVDEKADDEESLYSYFLNRRHSAFLLVGSAMRLGLTLRTQP